MWKVRTSRGGTCCARVCTRVHVPACRRRPPLRKVRTSQGLGDRVCSHCPAPCRRRPPLSHVGGKVRTSRVLFFHLFWVHVKKKAPRAAAALRLPLGGKWSVPFLILNTEYGYLVLVLVLGRGSEFLPCVCVLCFAFRSFARRLSSLSCDFRPSRATWRCRRRRSSPRWCCTW